MKISDFGFRNQGLGVRDQSYGSRVSGLEVVISGFGFRVSGFGSKVKGFGICAGERAQKAFLVICGATLKHGTSTLSTSTIFEICNAKA